MKKKALRVGVIGGGAIAQHAHIPGYAAGGCVLAALADPEPRCRKEVRERGFKFAAEYDDYRAMLAREELDVVSICTPNAFHSRQAVDCLKRGCAVLLEKPVAMTAAQGEAIRRAQAETGGKLMVGFTHTFNPLNLKAREALRKGEIGKPYMIRIRFAHTGPFPGWARTDWFYNPKLAGGGAILDMGIHAINLTEWFLGPIRAVSAKAATLRKKIAVDDNALLLVELDHNCLGYIEVGWTSPAGFVGVELMGDRGCLTVDYSTGEVRLAAGRQDPSGKLNLQRKVLLSGPQRPAWQLEMEYFIGRLRQGKGDISPSLADGLSALRVALAAQRSSRSGRRVTLT